MKHTLAKYVLGLAAAAAAGGTVALVAGGCSTDAYRRSADADVYRLLKDRKERALGYDPQAVAEPVLRPQTQPAADGGARAVAPSQNNSGRGGDPVDAASARNRDVENGPATPTKRSYAAVPLTPLPPSEPPALERPPEREPWGPLGPRPDEPPLGYLKTGFDPFAADMSGRWSEDRLQYGPARPRRQAVELDLFGALRYAVQNSRRYRDQMDDLYAAALDVTLERHLLSPRPFAKGSLAYTGGQRESAYKSALSATMDAGVRQRLPYGGEVVAEALVGFVHALDGNVDDGETASVALSGSVPLLRGAGLVNLEALISSERELVYRVRAFEDFRRQFAIDVAREYFNLQAAYQSVNNRRQNVANSLNLLDRARSIYAANIGAAGAAGGGRAIRVRFIDVQRAEQSLLDAQNTLIDAQESYLNQLDTFKLALGMDVKADVEIVPVALDVNVPELTGRDLLATATRYRLDLQTARDRIDDARRQVAVAENGLLPDLSITGRAELGNRVGRPASDLDSRALTYTGGLTLDLPIDRLAERNAYRLALVQFHRTARTYDDLADRVAADVRAAVRAIRNSEVTVQIQRRSVELAKDRLENTTLLFKRGDVDSREVVDAQQALLRSQDSYERARADLQVQVLQFLRNTGTLRVDPDAGTIGRALDRTDPRPPVEPPTTPVAPAASPVRAGVNAAAAQG